MQFRIRHGGVAGEIPSGWTATGPRAGGDSTAALTLASGDSLLIVFRTVTLDSAATAYFAKRGVADLAMLTRTLHDSTLGTVREGIETFRLGGREFASYEARVDGGRMRVAVFSAGGYYYECEAVQARPLSSPRSYERLVAAQQAVLGSLR